MQEQEHTIGGEAPGEGGLTQSFEEELKAWHERYPERILFVDGNGTIHTFNNEDEMRSLLMKQGPESVH